MCDALLFGTALSGTSTATAGLFGVGGTFSLGTTLSTLGTAFGAIQSYQQGKQQERLSNVQAQINEQQAQDAIERGKVKEDAQRRKIARLEGTQRATFGSQLVELDSGSASSVLADTAMLGELDALTIRNNAQREAYGYRSQAASNRFQGKQAKQSGLYSAAGGLLELGGKTVSSKWYDSKSALTQSRASFETTGRNPQYNLV